ncbi:MAG: class I SAM-dependent methyltransferase [Acidobacteriaceae bacterium]
MSTSAPSIEQIKASMRTAWTSGDFAVIASSAASDAAAFVERIAPAPGSAVLDVACGNGNLAIPAAQRGCLVTGVDIAPNILIQARARSAEAGCTVQFDEGDAEQLPYPDATFDLVITMFGAMFAPRPELVASEFARVLKPGGRLAMANWNPESFTAAMFKTTSKHAPPPPGVPSPILWGDDTTVRTRLSPYFTSIATERIPLTFDFPYSPAGVVDFFRTYYGPTLTTFNRLDAAQQQALAADLEALWSDKNIAPDTASHTVVPNEYMQITAVRS